MKKFTNAEKEAEQMFREYKAPPLTEEAILLLDTELAKFGRLSTRHNVLRWLVHTGAAKWIGESQIAIIPGVYETQMDKARQWRKWRERAYPFDMRAAYQKIADDKAALARTVTESASVTKPKQIVHIGTTGTGFEYPSEEINVDDIPF